MSNVAFPLTFHFPSGDVSQWFQSWNSFLSPVGKQVGFVNVMIGNSKAPEVEKEILSEVGSYGRQLGRIGDAMTVLLNHLEPKGGLAKEEREAVEALKVMLREIADIRERHDRKAIRP